MKAISKPLLAAAAAAGWSAAAPHPFLQFLGSAHISLSHARLILLPAKPRKQTDTIQ